MQSALRQVLARIRKGARIANYWLIAQFALMTLRILRLLPARAALNFVDRAARRVGPLTSRHRVAMDNLRAAYPEKSEAELQAIGRDMWANMARLAAEYVFLQKLIGPPRENGPPDGVDLVGEELFLRVRGAPKPRIFFTAHMGNFELLPMLAASYGLPTTALFRAPNNPFLAAELLNTRTETMSDLVASGRGSAFALARVLEAGGNIGVLVDQKFYRGVKTNFFGRPCETSPLLAKLARQYDCDVHPAVCTRLPDGRFRVRVFEAIDLPRTERGAVDVPATTQLVTDIVEGWVRENPGQWMWFHRRWQMAAPKG